MNLSRRTVAELFPHLEAIFNLRIHFMMAESEQLPFSLFCYFFKKTFFYPLLCSGTGCRRVVAVRFLVFVVVTAPNLICNGYQLVRVFTIANGENKSVFAVFII